MNDAELSVLLRSLIPQFGQAERLGYDGPDAPRVGTVGDPDGARV